MRSRAGYGKDIGAVIGCLGIGLAFAIPAIVAMFKLFFWVFVWLIAATAAVFMIAFIGELIRDHRRL